MNVAFRKVWRDLWNFKGRTLLVVLSIAVGVMALGMTTASNNLLKGGISHSRAARHPSDARLSFVIPFDDDVVQTVANMPEVADAEGRLSASVRWKPTLEGEWKDAVLTMAPDYDQQVFDRIELRGGQWPGLNEIAIEYNDPEHWGMPPLGGTIYVQVNNNPVPIRLVGYVRDPLQLPPQFNFLNKAAIYVNRETAEHLVGTRNFNQLSFNVPVYSEANVQQAVSAVNAKLKRLGVVSATAPISTDIQDPTGDQTQTFIDGLGLILITMAVFSLGLSVTLVINTINAIVAQQVIQIGIMKTIGGLYTQIVTLYLAGVTIYGLLSLCIAVPLGTVFGYYMSAFWLTAFNVPPAPFAIQSEAFIYQVSVGVLTPLAAALWPVMQGVSVPVRQAIAAYGLGTGHYGAGWLDRLMGRIIGFPRMLTLALRNTFRRAGRVVLTEITLISAGAIFMMVVTTGESFTKTIDDTWASWGFDVLFVLSKFERITELETAIRAQPEVTGLELWTWAQTEAHLPGLDDPAHTYSVQLRGVPLNSGMFNVALTVGRLLLPGEGHAMVLNQKIAADMGVGVGDQVVVDYGNEKTATWTVVGLVRDIGAGGIQDTAFVWRNVLNSDIGQAGRANVAQIVTADGTFETQDSVKNLLKTYFERHNISSSLSTGQVENKRLSAVLWNLIGGLLQVMTFLVAIVGSIGLSGTLSINVMERRREIGVMRAVGASSGDVAFIFMSEGLLLGVISWAIAVPLSMVGAQFFVDALSQALAFPFFYTYSLNGMWLWLGIILFLSVVASWLPARRATQISVRESLAYE
jgi:putative ABC transport system permease protein